MQSHLAGSVHLDETRRRNELKPAKSPKVPMTHEVTNWLIFETHHTGFAPSHQVVGTTSKDGAIRVSDNIATWDFAQRIAKTDGGDAYLLQQRAFETDGAIGLSLDIWCQINGLCTMRDVTDEFDRLLKAAPPKRGMTLT